MHDEGRPGARASSAWPAGVDRDLILAAVPDAIADPIFVKDGEGRFVFGNPALYRHLGKRPEEVIGRTDAEVYGDPALAGPLVAVDRRVMASGRGETVKEVVATPFGLRTFLTSKVPFRDRSGRIAGVLGVAQDITELERAVTTLASNEQRYRRFFENIHEGAMLNHLVRGASGEIVDGEVIEANPSALGMLGRPAAEIAGRRITEVFGPDAADWLREARRVMASPSRAGARDVQLTTGQHLHTASFGLDDDTYVTTAVDVTQAHRTEEQLRHVQRLESVGRLAGGVAHDFNNLLTVVLVGVESLRASLRAGVPPDAEAVDDVASAAESARALTRQLLTFARKSVAEPVTLDLNVVLRRAERMLARVLGEDVRVVLELRSELWTVRCDPGAVDQVILNLALNARDAMPRGGTLTLGTANAAAPPVAAGGHGDWVKLTVTDDGVGMSDEVKARLFEPFFTTKAQRHGTGLGLATVYGIVRQHGGHIEVVSEPGRGASFDLYFPRTLEPVDHLPPSRAPAPAPARAAATVLVVEDDPMVREVIVRSLRSAGYDVLVASHGGEAFTLERAAGRIDLLLTDVVMPGPSGREVADALRARRPGLLVLYMTGYTGDVVLQAGLEEGRVAVLSKPFTAAALLARVREILGS